MLFVSEKSKKVKQKLEEIKSDELNGKDLLKIFLDHELKEKLATKTNAKSIMDASQNPDSNIYKFATLLEFDGNIDIFKKAGKKLGKSLDSRCLFYDLIYQKSLDSNTG